MSASGEVYVEVNAEVVNSGISMLDASGGTGEGEGGTTGVWWLLWEYHIEGESVSGGYTGQSWYWGYTNNYLTTAWENSTYAGYYGNNETGFKKYLAEVNPPDLNEFLGKWDRTSKANFVNTYVKNQYPRCVELR